MAEFKFSTKNFNKRKALQIAFCEFMSAVILMYVGSYFCQPIGFAIGILIAIQLFGHISGVHINPAVTIGALIMNAIELMYVPFYILPQFLGCFAGYALYMVLQSDSKLISSGYCSTKINVVTQTQGVFLELIMTMLIVLVCCNLWDIKNKNKPDTGCIKFFFIILGCATSCKDYTGSSFNSARSFPPAVFSNDFKDNWIYWVGPNLGGAIGAFTYKFLLLERDWEL